MPWVDKQGQFDTLKGLMCREDVEEVAGGGSKGRWFPGWVPADVLACLTMAFLIVFTSSGHS